MAWYTSSFYGEGLAAEQAKAKALEIPTENDPAIQTLDGQTSRAFYHLLVRNKGKNPAHNCQITVRFVDAKTKKQLFKVSGKWDRGPQPLLYAPVPERILPTGEIETSVREFPHDFLVPFAEVLDVHPAMPEGFCIIVKYDGQNECYAFSTLGYLRGGGHRVPEWKLDLGEYHAIIELKYSGGKFLILSS